MTYVVPITFEEANRYVRNFHRHHKPCLSHKFSVAIADDEHRIRGVAIVGRPVSRILDDGWTLEVTRCCTDGVPNGCSQLYGVCRRVTFALGYRKLITYTLATESGASLRGAGWKVLGQRNGGSWNTPCRPRVDKAPTQAKLLWEAVT